MKYDRPVWQIMHACADAMPDVFRYDDVRAWFEKNYPDVNEATIRAHLIGLTEGGRAKHVQFAQRSPVFRRVARGEYEAIPVAERGESPGDDTPSASKVKMGSGPGSGRSGSREVSHDADDPTASAKRSHGAPETHTDTTPGKKAAKKITKAADDKASETAVTDEVVPRPELVESVESDPDDTEQQAPDVVLLGSVGDRVNVPAPAKEIFREVTFQLSRLDAELSGCDWFVLSAEHGLVAPNEWISPDSRTLADMDPDYRVAWAGWVVARLQSLVGSLDGMLVRVDAPDAFIGPLFADLQEAGAVVSSGNVGVLVPPLSVRERDEPFSVEHLERAEEAAVEAAADELVEAAETAEADVVEIPVVEPLSPAATHLADVRHAVPAAEIDDLPDSPGLYGWFVDPVGARELNRCLMLPVRPGLIFVGQVGGSSWQSLADPVLNLRDHVGRIQLHGRARASTFRMTLATVLRDYLRMSSFEDPRLTEWMLQHLSIAVWPTDDFGALRELEQVVVGELDPPLNVDHLPATEYRARLSQLRSALA